MLKHGSPTVKRDSPTVSVALPKPMFNIVPLKTVDVDLIWYRLLAIFKQNKSSSLQDFVPDIFFSLLTSTTERKLPLKSTNHIGLVQSASTRC